jgi:hypothetical protein
MNLFLIVVYVLIGCGVAYFIHRDGEFRPIDTTMYSASAVFVWPVILPLWMISRPPSQVKDLNYEKSFAHFKDWSKTHKPRDIGDLSYFKDPKKDEGKEDYIGDVTGATSPDKPYVIGENSQYSMGGYSIPEDDYIDEDSLAHSNSSNDSAPRKVYNPFDSKTQPKKPSKPVPKYDDDDDGRIVINNGRKVVNPTSKASEVNKSSTIADIIDSEHAQIRKAGSKTGKPFRDPNVQLLIEKGKLRDAYRVSKRLLKVAHELGEDDRAEVYLGYLNDIENRIGKEQDKSGDLD